MEEIDFFLSQTQDWNTGDKNSIQASKTSLRMKQNGEQDFNTC